MEISFDASTIVMSCGPFKICRWRKISGSSNYSLEYLSHVSPVEPGIGLLYNWTSSYVGPVGPSLNADGSAVFTGGTEDTGLIHPDFHDKVTRGVNTRIGTSESIFRIGDLYLSPRCAPSYTLALVSDNEAFAAGYADVKPAGSCYEGAKIIWMAGRGYSETNLTSKDVSVDGTMMLGGDYDDIDPLTGSVGIYLWKGGVVEPLSPKFPIYRNTVMSELSGDGKYVFGDLFGVDASDRQMRYPFRWNPTTGELIELGPVGYFVDVWRMLSSSYDGNAALFKWNAGSTNNEYAEDGQPYYLWRAGIGSTRVRSVIRNETSNGTQIDNYSVVQVTDMSGDGQTVVGRVMVPGSVTNWRPFVAQLERYSIVDQSPWLLDGYALTKNVSDLATRGRSVSGVSADGVSKILVRVPGFLPGDAIKVELLDQNKVASTNRSINGAISDIATDLFITTSFNVTATNTSFGAYAFVQYIAPIDFNDGANFEYLKSRQVFIRFTRLSDGKRQDVPIYIVRPPVALIHGTFSSPQAWDGATHLTRDGRFHSIRLNYSDDITDAVTATVPDYRIANIHVASIRANTLGISYNTPRLLSSLESHLAQFRKGKQTPTGLPVAASQVDVIGHSLGGLMGVGMRTLSDFFNDLNYRKGYYHKIITIGSPHRGTPHANYMLNGSSSCSAELSSMTGSYPFSTVQIDGKTYTGAVEDQRGDANGEFLSIALQLLDLPPGKLSDGTTAPAVPLGILAGRLTSNNFSDLVTQKGLAARHFCSVPDYVAENYSNEGWSNIFGGKAHDGIVPFLSATKLLSKYWWADGVVHGEGTAGGATDWPWSHNIGFYGPHLLEDRSGAPTQIIHLLNASVSSNEFNVLP